MRLQGDMVREEVLRNVVRHLQGGKAQKTEIFCFENHPCSPAAYLQSGLFLLYLSIHYSISPRAVGVWQNSTVSRDSKDCTHPFLVSREDTGGFQQQCPESSLSHSSPLVVKCSQHGKVVLSWLCVTVERTLNTAVGTLVLLV